MHIFMVFTMSTLNIYFVLGFIIYMINRAKIAHVIYYYDTLSSYLRTSYDRACALTISNMAEVHAFEVIFENLLRLESD